MRALKLFSKTLHFAMLFCFCLPFLKGCSGCEQSAEEMAARAKSQQDSIAAWELIIPVENTTNDLYSTTNEDSAQTETIIDTTDLSVSVEKEKTFYEKFVSTILQPNGDFSGLGLVVLGIELNLVTIYISLFPFILLVIISLLISFRKQNTFKWIFIFSIIELICLLIFYLIFNSPDILYGYWLSSFLCVINSITLYFIRKKIKFISRNLIQNKSAP